MIGVGAMLPLLQDVGAALCAHKPFQALQLSPPAASISALSSGG